MSLKKIDTTSTYMILGQILISIWPMINWYASKMSAPKPTRSPKKSRAHSRLFTPRTELYLDLKVLCMSVRSFTSMVQSQRLRHDQSSIKFRREKQLEAVKTAMNTNDTRIIASTLPVMNEHVEIRLQNHVTGVFWFQMTSQENKSNAGTVTGSH